MRFLPNIQTIRNMAVLVRQNFSVEVEKEINRQINLELSACYEYMAIAWYFDRTDVSLPGISKWCKEASNEEKVHAEKLMTYMNKRGGDIVLQAIGKPRFTYRSFKQTMNYILDLEKIVNESLLQVHTIATEKNDANCSDFIESQFLEEQVDTIKEISDYIRQIERCEKELGVYLFDRKFMHH